MARNKDRDRIASDGLRQLSRVASAQFCRQGPVVRGLPSGYRAEHRPHTDLIGRSAQIEWDARIEIRLFDRALDPLEDFGQIILAEDEARRGKSRAECVLHREPA